MRISRWMAAAAVSALVLVGLPGQAWAEDDCASLGGLLGLSLDDCGLRVTLLGVEVQLGGDDSGGESGSDSGTSPAESAEDPADPAEDGAAGSGSGPSESPDQSSGDARSDATVDPPSRSGDASDGSGGRQNSSGSAARTTTPSSGPASTGPSRTHDAADGSPSGSGEGPSGAPDPPAATAQVRGPLASLPGLPGSSGPGGWVAVGLIASVLLAIAAGVTRGTQRRQE